MYLLYIYMIYILLQNLLSRIFLLVPHNHYAWLCNLFILSTLGKAQVLCSLQSLLIHLGKTKYVSSDTLNCSLLVEHSCRLWWDEKNWEKERRCISIFRYMFCLSINKIKQSINFAKKVNFNIHCFMVHKRNQEY